MSVVAAELERGSLDGAGGDLRPGLPPPAPHETTGPSLKLARQFLLVVNPDGSEPRIPRLSWLIATEQWVGAMVAGDADRMALHAYRMDRLVDNFIGIGQVERLRRHLGFE